jgi:hypothetical protein
MREILHLNLHREFFDAIATGRKKIEYRRRSPYWRARLEGRKYDMILFRNGYASSPPEMLVEFAICVDEGGTTLFILGRSCSCGDGRLAGDRCRRHYHEW